MRILGIIWIVLFIPLLSFTTDSDKPCKPVKNKRKASKFISSLHIQLNRERTWDSSFRIQIQIADSIINSGTKKEPVVTASSYATFPGGTERFYEYVKDHITVCNLLLKEVKKNKKYTFQFRVNIQGNIDKANLTEEFNDRFSKEIENILLKSPKWIPSFVNGKFINTDFKFRLTVKN